MIPLPFVVPIWGRWLGGIVAVLLLLAVAKSFYDRMVIDRHEAEVADQVRKTEAAAATAAADAVNHTKDEVERKNAEARDAARRSDDPLKSGLDRLRH